VFNVRYQAAVSVNKALHPDYCHLYDCFLPLLNKYSCSWW